MRVLAVLVSIIVAGCATSGDTSTTWVARSTDDPITGQARCTVLAPDRFRGRSFTRSLSLYPFVETASDRDLMVGVSSGGPVRVPPGDIQWRVDQNDHRTFHQAQTPVIGDPSQWFDASTLPEDARAAYEASQQSAAGMLSSIQNGITAVDGDAAQRALAEMMAGSSLIFRSSTSAPAAGVPSDQTHLVGQYRNGRLEPIPLDASFHAALAECGITSP